MPEIIHKAIAAIRPEIYCQQKNDDGEAIKDKAGNKVFDKVMELSKKGEFLEAAKIAVPIESKFMDIDKADISDAYAGAGLKNPREFHKLNYEALSEGLESIYFWLMDNIEDEYDNVDKIADTFASAPGSGHFSEMGQKSSTMQQQAMNMLGAANQVIKSILNLIYDLKEFKMRLAVYDRLKSEKKEEKESALYSLKQLWMDTVDIKRGNSSIKAMAISGANAPNFVTLIDAFMSVESTAKMEELEKGNALDLNDRVKRLLKQRLGEFEVWVKISEEELRKRYEIEKTYLKSQLNTVKLYARWARPYLDAARRLEQNAARPAALVTAFNTSVLELALIGHKSHKVAEDVGRERVHESFLEIVKKKFKEVIVVEMDYISIPDRNQQGGYGFKGRVQIRFTSYCLTEEEIGHLKKVLDQDDFNGLVKAVAGATDDSLAQLQADIDEILEGKSPEDKKKEEEDKKKKEAEKAGDSNPFAALFSFFKSEKKEEKKPATDKDKLEFIPNDNDYEKVIRNLAIIAARRRCNGFYAAYKGAHGMPNFP